jgi:hypothetical protein
VLVKNLRSVATLIADPPTWTVTVFLEEVC